MRVVRLISILAVIIFVWSAMLLALNSILDLFPTRLLVVSFVTSAFLTLIFALTLPDRPYDPREDDPTP